jgi:hypothetical protein
MLTATQYDLGKEANELAVVMRAGMLPAISQDRRSEFVRESQKYIRLANQFRSYYAQKQKSEVNVVIENQDFIKLFDILDKSGTLQRIMSEKPEPKEKE